MADRDAEQWVPLHSAHAIEQFLFTLQFDRAIDEAAVKTIRDRLKDDAAFPAKNEIRTVGIEIGAGGGRALLPASGVPTLSGMHYQKTRDDGTVETELKLDRTAIAFRTIAYTHWETVWGAAKQYVSIALPVYLTAGKLVVIGLNYVDKFIWQGALERASPLPILRPESKYLAPRVYGAKDLWHTHSGEFVSVDNQTKRLVNVDVDYVDEYPSDEPRRALVIKTVLNDAFNQFGYAPTALKAEAGMEFIGNQIIQLHDLCKDILGNIISSDMAKRIALEG